jgi:transposase
MQEPSTMQITTIGLDLAKSVFQVHGVDAGGQVVIRKKLRRSEVLGFFAVTPTCLVGMEACATSHYWARELSALGHRVKLMAPSYVKAYLRRQKNDAADAEAICEAVARPAMRFVPIKSADRQSVLALHRTRDLLVRQRTMLINAIRGHLAEFGIIAPQGARSIVELVERIRTVGDTQIPDLARDALLVLAEQLDTLALQISRLERRLLTWHRQDQASQRLATIPGVGIITATALAATVTDPSIFKSGREFAAFLGLVPRQNSSGGKERLGRISKMGDGYLRRLLVVGATSVIRRARTHALASASWIRSLLERRPARVVTVAMANKTARIAWAVLARSEVYHAPA